MEKSNFLEPIPDQMPQDLKDLDQWVDWKIEKRGDKETKVPVDPKTGKNADCSRPETWGSFKTAKDYFLSHRNGRGGVQGYGFQVTKEDPYIGIDLDRCRDPKTGKIEPKARAIVRRLNSYTEISPSGTGIRIFIKGKLPAPGNRKGPIELYESGRYLTVTGHHLEGTPLTIEDRQTELTTLHRGLFSEKTKPQPKKKTEKKSKKTPSLDDQTVIQKCMNAKNGQKFSDLFDGNIAGYPSPSEADLALCSHLGFYSQDPNQIDRIFRLSVLMRPKWDEPRGAKSYGQLTIETALKGFTKTYQGQEAAPEKVSKTDFQKNALLEIATKETSFFKSPDDRAFATIKIEGHKETHLVLSKKFRLWLSRRFNESYGKIPTAPVIKDVINIIEARALFGKNINEVFVRIGQHEGRIYIDLANDQWEAVEISATGWRVVSDPPIHFIRPPGLYPLPYPVKGNGFPELRKLLAIKKDSDFILLVAFLIGSLKPKGPYAILDLQGEQGCGKSVWSKVSRELMDPNSVDLRSLPKEERDLLIAAQNGWLLVFDNCSGLSDWLSDCLCRMSTGGGNAFRELYSDDSEKLFSSERPIIINGIGDIIARHDLLDRAIILNLVPIPENARKMKSEIMAEFEKIRPEILADLYDAVSMALRNEGTVKLQSLPRMADFAQWICQAEPALPWASGEFLKTYSEAVRDAIGLALANDPIVERINILLAQIQAPKKWEGTAKDLYSRFYENENILFSSNRPKSEDSLARKLKRLVSFLRVEGIEVSFSRTKTQRIISIREIFNGQTGDTSGDTGDTSKKEVSPKKVNKINEC